MERIWNYFFYFTWRLTNVLGNFFIDEPIEKIVSLIPFFRRNKEERKKSYDNVINDRKSGYNIRFAFGDMLVTTSILYMIVCLYLVKWLNIPIGDTIDYYFIAIPALSILTNYFFFYYKDI